MNRGRLIRRGWSVFRAIVSCFLVALVGLPAALYVGLSLEPVQNKVRNIGADELSKILGADISIERVRIQPFSRLSVSGVTLCLDGDSIARVDNVSAGFRLFHFLKSGELVIDYALLYGFQGRVWRDSVNSPLNIQPILDHLRSDEPHRQKAFELKIDNVIIRDGNASYDILSAPRKAPGEFDINHVALSQFALNAFIPRISNDDYRVSLDHLSFIEQSGFNLTALRCDAELSNEGILLDGLEVDLLNSHIGFEPLRLPLDSLNRISAAIEKETLTVVTTPGTTIYPPDFSVFVPQLETITRPMDLDMHVQASMQRVNLERFNLRDATGGALSVEVQGSARGLRNRDSLQFDVRKLEVVFDGHELAAVCAPFMPGKRLDVMRKLEHVQAQISAKGSVRHVEVNARVKGSAGALTAQATLERRGVANLVKGEADFEGLRLGLLTGVADLGSVTGAVEVDGSFGRELGGTVKADLSKLDFKNYPYTGVKAMLMAKGKNHFEADLSLTDPNALLQAYLFYDNPPEVAPAILGTASISRVDFEALGLSTAYPGYRFGAKANVNLSGTNAEDMAGDIQIYDLSFFNDQRDGVRLSRINITADPNGPVPEITVSSPIVDATLSGTYAPASLIPEVKSILHASIPALVEAPDKPKSGRNCFTFNVDLKPSDEITSFFKLPVHVVYPANINGYVDTRRALIDVIADVPYLRMGDKIVESTMAGVSLDTINHRNRIYASTQFPTKKGDMVLSTIVEADNNDINTRVDWTILREIPINGSLNFGATINSLKPLDAEVAFKPGTINFGEDTWLIAPSRIGFSDRLISVDKFKLDTGNQSIAINGRLSDNPADSATVSLANVSLLPIFENLNIDKALIGGRATGTFVAREVLSKIPRLQCDDLHVDSIGYNRCTIGDADILANWDNEKQGFYLDADIIGQADKKSHISGHIFPMTEALDINFEADSVPVGFLKPFMEAFTSDISGYATGQCRLFGTFKEIDLEGKVFADNVRILVDFINVAYTATDTIYLSPGHIGLDNITIHDPEGNAAKLNGFVGHTFFKEPTFRFDITGAQDFLSYNGTPKQNPDWYGTIYGTGGASVSGEPGVVNINVNMSTGPRSIFTFVLTDRLDATDYSFITFRDATPDSIRLAHSKPDDTPEIVRRLREKLNNTQQDEPSAYNMDFRVDITPAATLVLVMDPTAGDEIRATGQGNMRLAYHSLDNALNMWGTYTVEQGSYRFTLQDIIIKDFTIKEGSDIKFDGDPYNANLNLEAYYATNANLSDLDESFLQDKELNRTNVPVHALMKVTGDMRQPNIDFNLEFPTLTSDTYRKVRSIVSTEDMMNRQIIYLLALNRFYTPDYMNATKGSELFSVASSTISSQLTNMLGKLSDKWSIAPNLRSDRGDFSDVEVDVALSSRLLNNRLILNGNLGYRDKSLNTNQFIGDFDIEYLLNRKGSWRLKAYNRYNDQNYYLRSAQTTQGIGIMFRRDFDSFDSFLKSLKKKKKAQKTEQSGE